MKTPIDSKSSFLAVGARGRQPRTAVLAGLALSLILPAHAGFYSFDWMGGFAAGGVVPDGNVTGWSDTRAITGLTEAYLQDVDVKLSLSGGWNGDLYAYLVHGSGFSVLLNRAGKTAADSFGYAGSGMDVRFDDSAMNGDIHLSGVRSILGGAAWAPDGRNVDPAGTLDTDPRTRLLGQFHGLDPNGQWTLFLADLSGGETTTVQSWGLNLATTAVPVPESGANAWLMGLGCAGLVLAQLLRPDARRST